MQEGGWRKVQPCRIRRGTYGSGCGRLAWGSIPDGISLCTCQGLSACKSSCCEGYGSTLILIAHRAAPKPKTKTKVPDRARTRTNLLSIVWGSAKRNSARKAPSWYVGRKRDQTPDSRI